MLKKEDYLDIIAQDTAGPNPDKKKSERLRSFKLPDRFIEPDSVTPPEGHIINIFCAFVMQHLVIIVADFARLVRLHVTSSSHVWQKSDVGAKSPVRLLYIPGLHIV